MLPLSLTPEVARKLNELQALRNIEVHARAWIMEQVKMQLNLQARNKKHD